jgi:hypothetical protein
MTNISFNDALMSNLFVDAGITKFVTIYSVKTLVVPVLIICSFTACFAYLVTWKISKVSPKNIIQE